VDEAAGEADEELGDGALVGDLRDRRVVEDDQVDIARIVELAGAELAHAEEDPAAALVRLRRVGDGDRAFARGLGENEAHRGADRGVGEAGERGRHRVDVGEAGEVGEGDEERRLLAGKAERLHQRGLVGLLPRPRRGGGDLAKALLRIGFEEGGEASGIVEDEPAQERRSIEDAGDEGV
jgi:hypothetical protein